MPLFIAKDSVPFDPSQLIVWVAVFAILLVAGSYVIGRIRAWAKSEEEVSPRADSQIMLTRMREAYERGELEEEEYRSIRERLKQAIHETFLKDEEPK